MTEMQFGGDCCSGLEAMLKERVVVLDGGMGTMIQRHGLGEPDYRGQQFREHGRALAGNHDVLALTRGGVIYDIHQAYIEAGADIIETCSFNANAVSQAEYGLSEHAPSMSRAAALIAREAAAGAGRPVLVAGAVGPANVSLSIAEDVERPERRKVDFDTLAQAYEGQIEGLVSGGVDLLLIETVFDALNAKAALYAYAQVSSRCGRGLPVMISASLADSAGRLLSGMSLEAFIDVMRAFRPVSIGLNCGFGVDEMERFLPILAREIPENIAVSCHPNAGLPDADGRYCDDAMKMARKLGEFARKGWVNIVGGCCGTTPDHIRAIAEEARRITPARKFAARAAETGDKTMRLCGLERVRAADGCLIIAERANVTGSRKFKRLIEEKKWDEALDVARAQMKSGASMMDVCMDDPMLDACACMREFLRRASAEPWISRHPFVLDSSCFDVIRAGLREVQGRCLVNSISLKAGEESFLAQAREIRAHGGAVVVMAFDEKGQASTTGRRVEILSRAVGLLTKKLGFALSDIAVDPNILAIGTGLEEHAGQAVSFVETCRAMREMYPGLQTVGGLSNLSFSFRGRDDVRAAIHHAFMELAGPALGMVIANPASLRAPDDPELADLARKLVSNASPGALENLLAWMGKNAPESAAKAPAADDDEMSGMPPAERIKACFVRGISKYIEADMKALSREKTALEIIEGPLMDAMDEVGGRFGRGEMFLPQIVKAARMMKQAIGCLDMQSASAGAAAARKKILIATVRGDVHDIGKNIVSIVLSCNGYEVIDLGVMVDTGRIVSEAARLQADAVGLSGLISPSLGVMCEVAQALNAAGIHVPLIVGGAAANDVHTAVRIAPLYAPGTVCHVADASRVPGVLGPWLSPETRDEAVRKIEARHDEIRAKYAQKHARLETLGACRKNAPKFAFGAGLLATMKKIRKSEVRHFAWTADELLPRVNMKLVARMLGIPDDDGLREAMSRVSAACADSRLVTRANMVFMRACRDREDIVLTDEEGRTEAVLYGFRVQRAGAEHLALADFVPEKDGAVGLFALTTPLGGDESLHVDGLDADFLRMTLSALAVGLVDAANDVLHEREVAPLGRHICPACGYPVTPDHSLKRDVLRLTEASGLGISLTESMMMNPLASICGFTIIHPDARYFEIGDIADDQWADYAARRGMPVGEVRKYCGV